MKKAILAYLIAPLMAGFAFFILSILFGDEKGNSPALAVFVALYSYIPSLAIGMPTHLILWRLQKEKLWIYSSVGIACGLIWGSVGRGLSLDMETVKSMAVMAFPCGLVAATFSVIKDGWKVEQVSADNRGQAPLL